MTTSTRVRQEQMQRLPKGREARSEGTSSCTPNRKPACLLRSWDQPHCQYMNFDNIWISNIVEASIHALSDRGRDNRQRHDTPGRTLRHRSLLQHGWLDYHKEIADRYTRSQCRNWSTWSKNDTSS
jgi:hypothetical protein